MKKKHPNEIHLAAIAHWAGQLPATEWEPGFPPQENKDAYFAVKTENGHVLTGRARAFRPTGLHWIKKKYGLVVAHVGVGD